MCACTETDVRESAYDCTLASGEGHSSRGETFHLSALQFPFPLRLNSLYLNTPPHVHLADLTFFVKLLLVLAIKVILGFESHGIHGHILMSDGSGSLQNSTTGALPSISCLDSRQEFLFFLFSAIGPLRS
jgi:hypothetical protein